jgi:hypothetical protein
MPGLDDLRVSLTKNGFFKIAAVILAHPRNEVLQHIGGTPPDPQLDRAQIVNMLSGDLTIAALPDVWDRVRVFGEPAVNALVLIAIIFSHRTLIEAFQAANQGEMRGVLTRAILENDKIFTNIAYSLAQAGVSEAPRQGSQNHPYNLASLFEIPEVGPLAKEVIELKLRHTGWLPPAQNDHFTRTFYEQCFHYGFHRALGISERQFEDWLEGRDVEVEAPPNAVLPEAEVTVRASLFAALTTKPFVILCGTTGTGKTQTIRRLANALLPADVPPSFNHVFMPVEAGWTDGRHLLGYRNPFGPNGETYVLSPLVELVLRANYAQYAGVPFFIILDEMNLSYVELYFSRFLSLMEAARDEHPEPLVRTEDLKLIRDTAVISTTTHTFLEHAIAQGGLFLTPNVFIAGTVNVDETTHMFSPKVLDRSFVLEFATVLPSQAAATFEIPVTDRCIGRASAIANFLIARRETVATSAFDSFLDEVYRALERYRFGHRIVQEARRFVSVARYIKANFACHETYGIDSSIKDALLSQKLLTKLYGNRGQIGTIVQNMEALAQENQCDTAQRKLETMNRDIQLVGFTNYFSSL